MADQEERENNNRRKHILTILAVIVLVAGAGYGAWWYLLGQYHESTDDAYVNGNVISISPQVAGTVVAINADNTDLVHAGDVLVRLDPTDATVAMQQAEANLAGTVRQVRQLFDRVAQLNASVALRQASLQQAQRDYQRALNLRKVKGISTENFQHAETALSTARAGLTEAEHELAASRAAVSGTTLQTHPQVRQAEAQLRKTWLALQRTRIVAPVSGYVAERNVQLGDQVTPGSKLMAVVQLSSVWVEANFKETDLAHVRIGQPVTLTADLYGDSHTYHGKVAGLAAGTGNAFALLPAQNATGNWIKVVQRVPVRIALDPADLENFPLRIGLSMQVDVDTHDRSGTTLAQQPDQGARLHTPVYKIDQGEVDTLIQRIVRENQGSGGDQP